MDKLYNLASNIIDHPKFLLVVLGVCCLFLAIGLKGVCDEVEVFYEDEENPTLVVESKNPKRHALVIYEAKIMPEDSIYKFEYHTDAQIIWSTEVYAVGDTIAFTTRKNRKKVKEEKAALKEENATLKAEIDRREKAWQSIKGDIQKTLLGY